ITISDEGDSPSTLNFSLPASEQKGSIIGELQAEGLMLVQVDVIGVKSVPTQGNMFFIHQLAPGVYDLILYAQDNQMLFPKPIGAITGVEVKANDEIDLGPINSDKLKMIYQ
ncbi:hypothetical protein K8I31_03915, partial [bacterium]|nr:hypothetical protein [bacterium]